jgi:hypothetical protein
MGTIASVGVGFLFLGVLTLLLKLYFREQAV